MEPTRLIEGSLPSFRETADAEPFGYYDRRRSTGPVAWDDGMQAWLVTSYEACKFIERNDDRLFRHAHREMSDVYVEVEGGATNIVFLHGEAHARLHRTMMSLLSPAKVHHWRSTRIRPAIHHVIDGFAGGGQVDLVEAFTQRLPVRVIAGILDLPYDDDDWIAVCKREMNAVIAFLERHSTDDDPAVARGLEASRRLNQLLMPYVLERRRGEGDDLISQLWRHGPAVLPDWSEEDVLANVRVLFLGGSDTTAHVLANAFHLLLTDEPVAARLRAGDPTDVERFTEETLRLFGAVHFRPRVANQDVEVDGVLVRQGDTVVCVNLAANRDPEKYSCPHAVEFARPSRRDHLAFHLGPRLCVGAALARAEIQESVSAVLTRLPGLRLDPAAEPPTFRGFLMRSYRPLNCRFDPIGSQSAG